MNSNDLDLPTGKRADARFRTMQAQLALRGVALWRTDPDDGPVQYITGYKGGLRSHRDLQGVAVEFAVSGGVFND